MNSLRRPGDHFERKYLGVSLRISRAVNPSRKNSNDDLGVLLSEFLREKPVPRHSLTILVTAFMGECGRRPLGSRA